MSLFGRQLRNAVSRGISDAIGKAVQQAVQPKANEYANRAAEHFDQAAGNAAEQTRQATSGLEGAFANLERSMQNYATEMSRNLKVCPGCQQPAAADQKFCPSCGTKLPEQTLAQGAVCPGCGKQNSIGMKFCSDCGTKLPAAVAEEEAAASRDAAVMAQWVEKLPQYPKWSCGGNGFDLEDYGEYIRFCADFRGNAAAAQNALHQYREILTQNGFRPAGQYPSEGQLFSRIGGVVYNVDLEHSFDGDPDCVSISFCKREPQGGFDYVKPEPKKNPNLKDLFRF